MYKKNTLAREGIASDIEIILKPKAKLLLPLIVLNATNYNAKRYCNQGASDTNSKTWTTKYRTVIDFKHMFLTFLDQVQAKLSLNEINEVRNRSE